MLCKELIYGEVKYHYKKFNSVSCCFFFSLMLQQKMSVLSATNTVSAVHAIVTFQFAELNNRLSAMHERRILICYHTS